MAWERPKVNSFPQSKIDNEYEQYKNIIGNFKPCSNMFIHTHVDMESYRNSKEQFQYDFISFLELDDYYRDLENEHFLEEQAKKNHPLNFPSIDLPLKNGQIETDPVTNIQYVCSGVEDGDPIWTEIKQEKDTEWHVIDIN